MGAEDEAWADGFCCCFNGLAYRFEARASSAAKFDGRLAAAGPASAWAGDAGDGADVGENTPSGNMRMAARPKVSSRMFAASSTGRRAWPQYLGYRCRQPLVFT